MHIEHIVHVIYRERWLIQEGGGLVRLSLFIEKFLHTPLTESSYKEEQFSLRLDTFM